MSAQIDIVSELREPRQGSWVRIEEIGKASTATLDDCYRLSTPSENLAWRFGAKRPPRRFAKELQPKTESEKFFAGFLLLACDGLGDLPREDTESFRFSARMQKISAVDTQDITTVY